MRSVQKIALSLLISVVAFTLFALFAFSGFFSFIESNFYDTRVRQQIAQHLDGAEAAVVSYRKQYFDRFKTIVGQDAIKRIDIVNQSAQDIFNRKNLFDKLLAENPGILFVRFVDSHGNIHFSTASGDVLQANQYQTVYKTLNRADPNAVYAKEIESTGQTDAVYIDGKNSRLLFRLPWVDYLGETVGSAVFYVSLADLQNFFIRKGVLDPGQTLSAVGDSGLAFGVSTADSEKLNQEVLAAWQSKTDTGGKGVPIAATAGGEKLFLFTRTVPSFGEIADLVPQSEFTLNRTLQLILSVSLFLTVFLLVFLLLSLRQDKLLVLADRIKRFQISFLKEYLESKSTLDWARWHSELELRRSEVRREIKKGIGRVSKEREATVDGLIDKSWDEILSVIGKRVDEQPAAMKEVKGLEEAIRRLLASGDLSAAAARGIPAPRPAAPAPPGRPGAKGPLEAAEEPEELAEVEELEEAAELESAEEPEELGEAEQLETAEEPEELAEVEELEEAAELESAEEPEELGAAEPLETAEEPEELGEAESLETAEEPEELAEVEELEEVEAVAEAPEAGATAEATHAKIPTKEAAPFEEAEEIESAEEPEELGEVEELEEAEAVAEIPEDEAQGQPAEVEPFVTGGEPEEVAEPEELEEVEEAPAEAETGVGESLQVGSGMSDELEDVEALDLEAIFHGDELMADIDIFEDSDEEAEEVETVPDELGEELEVAGVGSPETQVGEEAALEPEEETGSVAFSEDEELEELEEVEPLEVTHPEIARELAAEEEELESIEILEPAEAVVEIGAASAENLQQVSYGFSFFREFSAARVPPARDLPDQGTLGNLVEIEESERRMNGEENGRRRNREAADENMDELSETTPDEVEAAPKAPLDQAADGHGGSAEEPEELAELEEAEALEGAEAPEKLAEVEELNEAEEPEELDELEEIEEAEAVEELGEMEPAESAEALSPFEQRIRELIGYKKIEIYSLSDVKSMGLVPEEAIEVSDGVFKIREEVVARTPEQGNEELKSLVDSVVSGGIGGVESPEIGQALSIPTVELSFEGLMEPQKEAGGRLFSQGRRKKGGRVMLTQNGFDYDSFRSDFRSSNIGVMKSLMRISQKADAIYAALLIPKNGGLVLEYSLGLDEATSNTFHFAADDPVLTSLFSQKDLIYIRIPKTGIKEFDSKIAPRDLRFMKGTIYLPVVFDGKPGYLFFGLKDTELSIHDYMLRIIAE